MSAQLPHEYTVDLQGRVIVDFIGHYEHLAQDFGTICQHIGIRTPALPHLRRASDRGDYRRYDDDRLAEMVTQHSGGDLDLLGHRFDPNDTGAAATPGPYGLVALGQSPQAWSCVQAVAEPAAAFVSGVPLPDTIW